LWHQGEEPLQSDDGDAIGLVGQGKAHNNYKSMANAQIFEQQFIRTGFFGDCHKNSFKKTGGNTQVSINQLGRHLQRH
jgi:hypothetical protein